MTVLTAPHRTRRVGLSGPVRPEDYTEFISYVTTCLNTLMSRLGKQTFSDQELAGLHPSLLRDLQPYSGQDVCRAVLGLLDSPVTSARVRGIPARHRIRKMRKNFEETTKFFEHNTGTYLNERGLREYSNRLALSAAFAEVFWDVRLPSRFDLHLEAEMDASALVQFLYLPEAPVEATDALMRFIGAWDRTDKLAERRKAFNAWYKMLLKFLPKN